MSIFFSNSSAIEFDIHAEYATPNRTFKKIPTIHRATTTFNAALFMLYQQEKPLPNAEAIYRRHFVLYTNQRDNQLLLVRVNTTQDFIDTDAVLMYDNIKLSDKLADRLINTEFKNWAVSYDRNIKYTSLKPDDLIDYEMLCSGEWWYFDRGIILNGITRYEPKINDDTTLNDAFELYDNQDCSTIYETCVSRHGNDFVVRLENDDTVFNPCRATFIYFELIPDVTITRRQQSLIAAPVSQSNISKISLPPDSRFHQPSPTPSIQQSIPINISNSPIVVPEILFPNSTIINQDPQQEFFMRLMNLPIQQQQQGTTSATVPMESVVPVEATTSLSHQQTTTSSVVETIPPITIENLIPSSFWFNKRAKELSQNNIMYFKSQIQNNYKK